MRLGDIERPCLFHYCKELMGARAFYVCACDSSSLTLTETVELTEHLSRNLPLERARYGVYNSEIQLEIFSRLPIDGRRHLRPDSRRRYT